MTLTQNQIDELRAEYGIECPQCPLARQAGKICRADYHEHNGILLPMKFLKGKP